MLRVFAALLTAVMLFCTAEGRVVERLGTLAPLVMRTEFAAAVICPIVLVALE